MKATLSTTILLTVLALSFSACSSPSRGVSAEGPATPAVPPVTSEEVQLGEIRIAMTTDCRITFTNRDSRKAQWSLPVMGPCYFAKDRGGKVKVYQHITKKKPSKAKLILGHSSTAGHKGDRDCEGMIAGIMVSEGRVLVATPPFSTHASCVGPQGGFDEKLYSTAWFLILKDQKYEEVKFPTK